MMPSFDAAFDEMGRDLKEIKSELRELRAAKQPAANGDLVTPKAAAKAAGVHVETLRKWVRTGRLKSHPIGDRQYRVSLRELAEFLNRPSASKGSKSAEEIAAAFLDRKRGA